VITPSKRHSSIPPASNPRYPLLTWKALRTMCAVAAFLWAMAPFGAHARDGQGEKPYALIFGTIWGPDNRPVYGVKIRIRRASEKKARWQLISDHNGEFAQRVPAGRADYVVSADVKRPQSKPNRDSNLQVAEDHSQVIVHVQNDERNDVGLHLMQQELPRK
jgi:hypothetical protein